MFERRLESGVGVSWIDDAIARGEAEPESLAVGWELSNQSANECLVMVDDLEVTVEYHDTVDWLKV